MSKLENFGKKILDGQQGKLLLQINKTFKGDSRFKLDQRFEKDVDIQKMPEKFKKKLQNDIMQKVKQKTKTIKKQQPPLIIRRFQPGTKSAEVIMKKAEGKKQYFQSLLKAEKKKLKQKNEIKRGIDKVKKANILLEKESQKNRPQYRIKIKLNKKELFKPSQLKLFE